MRTRHDLPIAWRLGAGFAAVVLVMIAFGAFMIGSYQRSDRIQREFTMQHLPLDDAMDLLEPTVLYVGIGVRAFMLQPDAATRRAADERIANAEAALQRTQAAADSARDREAVARVAPGIAAFLALSRNIVSGAAPADGGTETRLATVREAALAPVHELVQAQRSQRAQVIASMERNRNRLAWAGVVAFVLVLAILAFVGFYTLRSIQRPTRELVRIASAMRAGDWKPALEWSPDAVAARGDRPNPRSELARIAHAFGTAAVALDRREARLRADGRVAAATASSLQRDVLARAVLEAIVDGAGATAGELYAKEDTGLVVVARHGGSGDSGGAATMSSLAHRALAEGPVFGDHPAAVAVPLAFRGAVLGVIAIECAHAPDAGTGEFLEGAGAQAAVGLANVLAHEKAQRLTEEVQAQNEEIQAQMEEIQVQSEQLQAQNEELQAQAAEIAHTNERLRWQADELTHADERKNEFLALLAHELRNPLAAIANSIFMLGHPQVQAGQAEKARAVIERQMRHLTRMIDDLLDVTRISRGKLRLQRESLDLAQVVRESVEDLRGAIDNAGLSLEVRMPDSPVRVVGDRVRLGQVLGNLLNNACKFTPAGGRIEVALEQRSDGGHADLRIKDSGIGIDGKLLAQLFEPFRQGEESHARPNAGLGLGLALARALVEMHGGSITARSGGVGRGSEFVVALPLAGASQPADARSFLDAGRRGGIVSEDFGAGDA